MKTISTTILALISTAFLISGCGGSSSDSGSGILIQGTLTEAGGAAHAKTFPKHGSGARIENVEICGLGECSITDGEGQWGFIAPESFRGGSVLLSVVGHGIDSSVAVEIPANQSEIFLPLKHVAGGLIEVGAE